ncbi:MAG: hypothetical protein N3D14_05160 [Aquificaceae bacterium]|nr:hypothetical protein [Aquificaceae bacterium]
MRYIVHTVEDLEKILRENPEWRERIRVLILTEELMKLPQKFESFVEEDFKPVKQKVENIEKDVSGLKQDITGVKQDVTTLKQDVEILKQDATLLKRMWAC